MRIADLLYHTGMPARYCPPPSNRSTDSSDRPWLVTATVTMLLSSMSTAHESLLIELAPSDVIAIQCSEENCWTKIPFQHEHIGTA